VPAKFNQRIPTSPSVPHQSVVLKFIITGHKLCALFPNAAYTSNPTSALACGRGHVLPRDFTASVK
jgi:hypothetical protein